MNYKPKETGKLAFKIRFNNVKDLSMIEKRCEFEYSKEDLELLAQDLINNKEDPIILINKAEEKKS